LERFSSAAMRTLFINFDETEVPSRSSIHSIEAVSKLPKAR
jgi:hypothetical protein